MQDRISIVPLKRQSRASMASALGSAHSVTFEESDIPGQDDKLEVMGDVIAVEEEGEAALPVNNGQAPPSSRSWSETVQTPPLIPEDSVEITPTPPQAADGTRSDNPEDDDNYRL